MKKFVLILIFALLLPSLSWGACRVMTVMQRVCSSAPYCTDQRIQQLNEQSQTLNSGNCQNYALLGAKGDCYVYYGCSTIDFDYACCDNSIEADSVSCVQNGQSWENGQCKPPCDSSKWTCETTTQDVQTENTSDNIQCINGTCWGTAYCEFYSISKTTCTNECGDITEQEAKTIPFRYEGHCDEDLTNPDFEQCSKELCQESGGQYVVYKNCASGFVSGDGEKYVSHIIKGGLGSCQNAGYERAKPWESLHDSTEGGGGGQGSQNQSNFSLECLQYGIGCDTTETDYSENRTQENGCTCRKYDGLNGVSLIVCPDGSSSTFFGSCDDWKETPYSSSPSPSSSDNPISSDSEGGGSSSPYDGWITYSQGEDLKALVGAVLAKQNEVKIGIDGGAGTSTFMIDKLGNLTTDGAPFGEISLQDSVITEDILDTAGLLDSLRSALFSADTINTIVDTLTDRRALCPICTIDFSNSTNLKNVKLVYDLSDLFGVNLCSVARVFVLGFAEIVAFMICAVFWIRGNK